MSAIYGAHPAMWGRLHNSSSRLTKKTNFYKNQNIRYAEEDGYFEVPTVTVTCIPGLCTDQSGGFGQWIMDK